MPSPIPRQVRWKLIRSYHSIVFGLPRNRGGSAPALVFSRPAQRLLTLRPACSPSRLRDPLHRRLQQLRCLRCCFDCYRVERTSSRAGLTPAVDHHLFTAHPVTRLVLLCHKRRVQQNGQQGSCLSRNLASLIRSVAIEYGLCRSARMRRTAGTEVGRNFLGA